VGLARHKDDLSSEPSLRETLSDPVIQALMTRDGVSPEEIVRLILVARARLMPPQPVPLHEANVLPFPVRREPVPDAALLQDRRPEDPRPQELRPKTRWPFCLRTANAPLGEEK
jgi:hypothetical protein